MPRKCFSFLQTKFEDLENQERSDFSMYVWNENRVSGKNNLLEKDTIALYLDRCLQRMTWEFTV